MTSRSEPEYVTTWTFDKYADASACNKGVGKLCETSTTHGVNRKLVYDSFGRPINSRTTIASGPSFATAVAYDTATGRISSQIYPTGLQVGYGYTSRGFLEQLTLLTAATVNPLPATAGGTPGPSANLPAGTVLWQAQVVNAWARTEQQVFGNGVTARAIYEAATGRATDLTAGTGGGTTVLNHHYTWDSLSNLTARTDNNGDGGSGAVSEVFTYGDSLNRLTSYTVSAPAIPGLQRTVNLQYNALGLLLYKSDVGNYAYPAQGAGSIRPHALQTVSAGSTTTYAYDGNGNLISATAGKYRAVTYTSFNLPDASGGVSGAAGTPAYTWQYDENHARIKETHVDANGTRTTWYLHPDNQGALAFESETAPSSTLSHRHYLAAGGQAIGVLVSTGALPALGVGQTAPTPLASLTLVKVEYWHRDHLGSLAATTDHAGAVTARYAYDPFGKRRFTNGTYDAFGNLVIDWSPAVNGGTDRGFTGHEHLDDVGLVHMNGRLFDATLAVFLQADPFIQDPANLLNYHRYGYCLNNPLTCTDPSGYRFLPGLTNLWKKLWHNPVFRVAAAIGVGIVLGPEGSLALIQGEGFAIGLANSAIAGFASGAIASGNLQGALQGMFTASLFYGAGSLADGLQVQGGPGDLTALDEARNGLFGNGGLGRVALHGVVGCVSSAVGGGKCGPGALSASFSELASPFAKTGGLVGGTIISAVAGGTASVLGGGKFANGAQTGAFGYLFNEVGGVAPIFPDTGCCLFEPAAGGTSAATAS